jgi:outer membrane protein TolC
MLAQYAFSTELRRQVADRLAALAADQNLSLSRLDTELRREQTAIGRNTASFLPRIGFRAALDFVDQWAERPGFEEKNPVWSVGAVVELPLLFGGARIHERAALRADLGGLQFGRDQAALEVEARVRRETARMIGLAINFPLAARAAEVAQEHLPLILDSYVVDERSITELLDAVDNDRRSTLRAINTQIEYFQSTARIVHALGIEAHKRGLTPGEELLRLLSE